VPLALAALAWLVVQAGRAGAHTELFVDADDPDCTNVVAAGAGEPTTPFCSIQAAIDHLEAHISAGGTLTLRAAVYTEGTLTVDHGDLVIRGDPAALRSAVVIRPIPTGSMGLHLSDPLGDCDNVRLEHFTLDGGQPAESGVGLLVDDDCDPGVLTDLEVRNWDAAGIVFADSSLDGAQTVARARIEDTFVHDNEGTGIELGFGTADRITRVRILSNDGPGISATAERDLRVDDSEITGNAVGIVLFQSQQARIEDSIISGNLGFGLRAVGPTADLVVARTAISANTAAGLQFERGTTFQSGTNTTIDAVTLAGNGGRGISAVGEMQLAVRDTAVRDNADDGIFLDDATGVVIENSTVVNNAARGIAIEDGTDVTVQNNDAISGSGSDGVQVRRSTGVHIQRNAIGGSGENGIDARDGLGLEVRANSLLGSSSIAIDLRNGRDSVLAGNEVRGGGGAGLSLLAEDGPVIDDNAISSNADTGLVMRGNTGAFVRSNDIIDNGNAPIDYGILVDEERTLVLSKNVISRNFDAQIRLVGSRDVSIVRNDITVTGDGIVFERGQAEPLNVVVGGSTEDRNRFRGLSPLTNICVVMADPCYVQLNAGLLAPEPVAARHNDWGTLDTTQINNLLCHNNEGDCGRRMVDFSDPEPPGDSPADKGPGSLPKDANCDGRVTAVDAAVILQAVAGLIPGVGCPQNADVNGDGRVNAVDATLVLQQVAGLI
jgi:parallel beta-helix repeat protein